MLVAANIWKCLLVFVSTYEGYKRSIDVNLKTYIPASDETSLFLEFRD